MSKEKPRKRKDGRYEVRKTINSRRISGYGHTKKEAIIDLQRKVNRIMEGKEEKKGIEPPTLLEAVVKTLDTKKGIISEKSYQTCVSTFNSHVLPSSLATEKVDDISAADLQGFLIGKANKGYSKSTINKIHSLLSSTYKLLFLTQQIPYNTMSLVKKPNDQMFTVKPKPVTVLTVEEMEKLEAAAELKNKNGGPLFRYGEAIVLLMHTGIRTCELQALRLEDIDLETNDRKWLYVNHSMSIVHDYESDSSKRILHLPKTEKSKRSIPLDERAELAVRRLIDTTSNPLTKYLVCTQKGNVVTYGMLLKCYDRMLKEAGIDHTGLHTLRHSFATALLQTKEGAGRVKEISELLGHSRVGTTYQYYIATSDESKGNLVDALNDLLSS